MLWAQELVGAAFSLALVPLRCRDLQQGMETKALSCDDPAATWGSPPLIPGRETWFAWRRGPAASPERAPRFSRGLSGREVMGAAVWAQGGSAQQEELLLVVEPGEASGGAGLRRAGERLVVRTEDRGWDGGGRRMGPGRGLLRRGVQTIPREQVAPRPVSTKGRESLEVQVRLAVLRSLLLWTRHWGASV